MKLRSLSLGALLCMATGVQALTPVATWGRLQAKSGALYDSTGTKKVVLRGMSYYWSSEADGNRFYNKNTVAWLQSDWYATVIRIPLAVEVATGAPATSHGYKDAPAGTLTRIKTLVDAAIDQEIYAVVDWHCPETNPYTSDAVTVFSQLAKDYKDNPNVMWEVWNEPTGSNGDVVTHANKVIAAIRAAGNKNLVIVGSSGWSSQPDQVGDVTDPQKNVAYTLHFYAGSGAHDAYRTNMTNAISKGRTVFVTEWGATTADGNSYSSFGNSTTWLNALDAAGVSSCNWDLGTQQANPANSADNTVQGSAALYRTVGNSGGWDPAKDLTPSGQNVRSYLRSKNTGFTLPAPPRDTFIIPTDTIRATGYWTATSFDTTTSSDAAYKFMGKASAGSVANYRINAGGTGYFEGSIRVNASSAGKIVFKLDGSPICTTQVAGNNSWTTLIDTMPVLVLGSHQLTLEFSSAMNISFVKLRKTLWKPTISVGEIRHQATRARILQRASTLVLAIPATEAWDRARVMDAQGHEIWASTLEHQTSSEIALPSLPSQSWVVLESAQGRAVLIAPAIR